MKAVFPENNVQEHSSAKPEFSSEVLQDVYGSWGSFGRFLKLVYKSPEYRMNKVEPHSKNLGVGPSSPSHQTGKDVALFPSLLRIPDLAGKPRSARRRARGRGHQETWEWVKMLWTFFTFLEGGEPYRVADQRDLLSRSQRAAWTPLHARYAGLMHEEIHRFVRLKDNNPLSRGIQKLDTLIQIAKSSQYKGLDLSRAVNTAKSVKPDRMSLPEEAGVIDPKLFLKGEHFDVFCNMPELVPVKPPPDPTVKGCFKVDKDDVRAVYTRLLESGVAVLLPEELAVRDSKGNLITGGLFAVDHKASSDRIILDRRPLNEIEKRLVWAKLPHGCLLTQLIVPKGYNIRGNGDDLSNYFYLLKHEESWLPRNAVGESIDGQGFEKFGGVAGKKFVLSFRVIPMGDLNAVDIAQQVHLEVLKDCHCMRPEEVISFKEPLPATHCFEGLYIDDHIVMQILPKKGLRSRDARFRDEEIMHDSRSQYAACNIPTSEKKGFTKADNFVAWGTEVDNASGRVGTPVSKLRQLSLVLSKVCKLRVISKKMLQKVTGLLVHPFMHRRALMCLLQETFVWIETLDEKESKPLPIAVKEELLTAALCLPLAHSNIRWEVSSRIGCSDASLKGGGRGATLTTPSIAQSLYRLAEHRGEHVRLDWAAGALAPASDMKQAPLEIEQLMLDHTWNETERVSFGHKQHINILESRMIYRELVNAVQACDKPLRCVLLVDSRAAAGAWSKGRSSSRRLNKTIRRSLGWTLAGFKSIHLVWVRSAANPADYPSRFKRIPDPSPYPSQITREILGDKLGVIQKRRSNRNIWRAVKSKPEQLICDLGEETTERPSAAAKDRERRSGTQNKPEIEHPAIKHWKFKEIFAGSAHLSAIFRRRNKFILLTPFELMHRGRPNPLFDILDNEVFGALCTEAKGGKQIWHFGFPCASFSLLQNMNGGTRSSQHPKGENKLEREKKGNEIYHRTLFLCKLLDAHHSFFTLENPLSSFAWKMPAFNLMKQKINLVFAPLDQCAYNLRIPDSTGNLGLAKKPTLFCGTLPGLDKLSKQCNHNHEHVQVIGGIKWKGKWVRRSVLAGAYPKQLCVAYSQVCEKLFI